MKITAPIDAATVRQLEETSYRVRKGLLTLVYNIGMGMPLTTFLPVILSPYGEGVTLKN